MPPGRAHTAAHSSLALACLARQEDLLGQAAFDDLAVQLGGFEQLLVIALGDDAPVVEHDDLIRQCDCGEAMGDHERGTSCHRLGERELD